MKNIERVKALRDALLLQDTVSDEINKMILTDAVVDSPINFENLTGIDALKAVFKYWKGAFPDVTSSWVSAEENKNDDSVNITWRAEATHLGDSFLGIEARGRRLAYTGETLYRFNDEGKLMYYCVSVDLDAIKLQL